MRDVDLRGSSDQWRLSVSRWFRWRQGQLERLFRDSADLPHFARRFRSRRSERDFLSSLLQRPRAPASRASASASTSGSASSAASDDDDDFGDDDDEDVSDDDENRHSWRRFCGR